MDRPKVLVIDDDANVTGFLKRALSYAGFAVTITESGEQGLAHATTQPPDVVVLDVLMPGLDGLEVCQRLRAGGNLPILMLTARDEVADRVRGLECGADDYLVKPFALEELIARLRALLRRHTPDNPHLLRFADLTVDSGTHEAWRGGRRVELTAREFDLLLAFLHHPRLVLSRSRLLDQVWGYDGPVETHVVEVYVRYLREKLEAAAESRLIHTVRGVGYVLRESEA